jgi:hypothetical protein
MSSKAAGIRWDASGARDLVSSIATATEADQRIVLNFGIRRGLDAPGQPRGATLARRVALHPMTAKHLHDILSRLLAETASNARGET